MATLKIKDNTSNKKDAFSNIKNLTDKIANKTLLHLEQKGIFVFPECIKDAEDLSDHQMILQSENDSYRSSNLMGYLGYEDERLIIRSRFGDENDWFFQYLLEKVLDFPNIVELKTDSNQDIRLFCFLLFLFPHYLQSAMRKGLFKEYIRSQYNDDHVKGPLDIARHIKTNSPFVGRVAYNRRGFSNDNSLIELVRHTIEFIKRKPYGNKLLVKVKDEAQRVISATPKYEICDRQKIIEQNIKKPLRHAFYQEYVVLQRLCLLILRHQKHQIGSGSKQIYGILFDGAWLWEEYVHSLISDIFHHPRNKARESPQHFFTKNDRKDGKIYPDFISRNIDNRMIADAKYKPIENIGSKDYLQLLAYMFRFDAKTGFYLYPETENTNHQKLFMNCGSTYENNVTPRDDIKIIKLGLIIPKNAKIYDDFVKNIKANEQDFIKRLKSY